MGGLSSKSPGVNGAVFRDDSKQENTQSVAPHPNPQDASPQYVKRAREPKRQQKSPGRHKPANSQEGKKLDKSDSSVDFDKFSITETLQLNLSLDDGTLLDKLFRTGAGRIPRNHIVDAVAYCMKNKQLDFLRAILGEVICQAAAAIANHEHGNEVLPPVPKLCTFAEKLGGNIKRRVENALQLCPRVLDGKEDSKLKQSPIQCEHKDVPAIPSAAAPPSVIHGDAVGNLERKNDAICNKEHKRETLTVQSTPSDVKDRCLIEISDPVSGQCMLAPHCLVVAAFHLAGDQALATLSYEKWFQWLLRLVEDICRKMIKLKDKAAKSKDKRDKEAADALLIRIITLTDEQSLNAMCDSMGVPSAAKAEFLAQMKEAFLYAGGNEEQRVVAKHFIQTTEMRSTPQRVKNVTLQKDNIVSLLNYWTQQNGAVIGRRVYLPDEQAVHHVVKLESKLQNEGLLDSQHRISGLHSFRTDPPELIEQHPQFDSLTALLNNVRVTTLTKLNLGRDCGKALMQLHSVRYTIINLGLGDFSIGCRRDIGQIMQLTATSLVKAVPLTDSSQHEGVRSLAFHVLSVIQQALPLNSEPAEELQEVVTWATDTKTAVTIDELSRRLYKVCKNQRARELEAQIYVLPRTLWGIIDDYLFVDT